MAAAGGFWDRVQDEVRTVSRRTRRGTRRAIQMGMLRVDLVSLRRDRSRALAHLGERALALWQAGAPAELERDPEAARLKGLIADVEDRIAKKQEALARLRTGAEPAEAGADAEGTGGAAESAS